MDSTVWKWHKTYLMTKFSILQWKIWYLKDPIYIDLLHLVHIIPLYLNHYHWAPSLLDKRITIVGRKYSVVTLYKNQKVYFQRDPDNENDKNAIVVRTYERNTVGHLPRSVAALYAPYLQMYTCVFGCITETYYGQFKTSMIIKKIIESKDHEILTLC